MLESPGSSESCGAPRLTDPERRNHYLTALGQWECYGYVILKPRNEQRLRDALSEYDVTLEWLCGQMFDHREDVEEIPERRPGYEHRFHYDFALTGPGGQRIYVETVLDMEPDPMDSRIVIVSIHDAD